MTASSLVTFERNLDIIKAIEKAVRYGGEIWQDEDEKQPLEVLHIQTDFENGQFILDLNTSIKIDILLPIKLHFFYRRTSLELNPLCYKVTGHRLWFNFPTSITALNKRSEDRYGFPMETNLLVNLKLLSQDRKLVAKLVDVSENGLGLILTGVNVDTFNECKDIHIEAIDQKTNGAEIDGAVVYSIIDRMRYGGTHIGIRLSKPLSKSMLNYLMRRGYRLDGE